MNPASLTLLFSLALVACTNQITEVHVKNDLYQTTKVISSKAELKSLNLIWASKKEIAEVKNINFPYVIDIDAKRRLPRFRYNQEGILVSSAIKEGAKYYQLTEPEKMNQLLGIMQPAASGNAASGAP